MNSFTSSRPPDLALELLDEIMGHVESPHDLLNFALSPRQCAILAIPRHIEYRHIWIGYQSSAVIWEHLVGNPRLAQGVRDIRISASRPYRTPSTLIEEEIKQNRSAAGAVTKENLFKALKLMPRLHTFLWENDAGDWDFYNDPSYKEVLLNELTQVKSLKRLIMGKLQDFRPREETSVQAADLVGSLNNMGVK